MVGVKIEAPKAPSGVGCGEAVPPPQKNFASKSHFCDAL